MRPPNPERAPERHCELHAGRLAPVVGRAGTKEGAAPATMWIIKSRIRNSPAGKASAQREPVVHMHARHRVSSFRGLPQNAAAPMRNCLDFGWRSRHLQKTVRWRGPAVMGRHPPGLAPRVVQSLSPQLNHDLAAVLLTLRLGPPGAYRRLGAAIWSD